MERQKRWQLYLIVAVLILTVYNILPVFFFHFLLQQNSLNAPIDRTSGRKVADMLQILARAAQLLRTGCSGMAQLLAAFIGVITFLYCT